MISRERFLVTSQLIAFVLCAVPAFCPAQTVAAVRFPMPAVVGSDVASARDILAKVGIRQVTVVQEGDKPLSVGAAGGVVGVPDFQIKLAASLAADQTRSRATGPVQVVKVQSPAAGVLVDGAVAVRLTVVPVERPTLVAPPPPPQKLVPVPNVMGLWAIPARNTLGAAGFTPRTTGNSVGRVTAQSPRGGIMAEPGSSVTIRIGR